MVPSAGVYIQLLKVPEIAIGTHRIISARYRVQRLACRAISASAEFLVRNLDEFVRFSVVAASFVA